MHSSHATAISDDIDIAALLRALNHRKFWIIGFSALAAILTFIALGFVAPKYYSEARIIIENENNYYKRPADSQSQNQQTNKTDQETVASQVQVLLSRDLALGVVNDLGLKKNPEFNSQANQGFIIAKLKSLLGAGTPATPATPASIDEQALDAFADRLSVYQLQSSRVIAVGFQSQNPEAAAKIANRLSELYLTWQQSTKLNQTKEASNWLKVQIAELTKKVQEADVAAEKFRSSTGLIEGSKNTSLEAQQLSELNSQIILAKAQRTEAEARADLIRRMLKEKGDVASAADVLKSNLIQRLLEQRVRVQRSLAEASVTLLPSHPRIRALNSELSDLKRQIRDEARKVVSSLQNEAQIAGAREASLRESLKELKVTTSKGNTNQIKLRALERELKSNRELLESYLSRYRDASARSDQGSVPAHASIVSRAHVSSKPSFPKKGPISLLAFAAIAFLGFAHTVARELIVPQQAQAQTTAMPHVQSTTQVPQYYDSEPQVSESVITVHSAKELARSIVQSRSKITVIMPMSAQPGVATEMLEPVRAIAKRNQSTIMVDALGQGSGVSLALELPESPGLFEMISGAAGFEESIRRDPKSPLQVISGNISGMTSQNTHARRFSSISNALEAAYDHVIYLAGPDETISILNSAQNLDPVLVLVTEPSMTMEDTLWRADQIFADKVDQPSLVVVANLKHKSAMRLPFQLGRTAG